MFSLIIVYSHMMLYNRHTNQASVQAELKQQHHHHRQLGLNHGLFDQLPNRVCSAISISASGKRGCLPANQKRHSGPGDVNQEGALTGRTPTAACF
jgi:hypothetical protein